MHVYMHVHSIRVWCTSGGLTGYIRLQISPPPIHSQLIAVSRSTCTSTPLLDCSWSFGIAITPPSDTVHTIFLKSPVAMRNYTIVARDVDMHSRRARAWEYRYKSLTVNGGGGHALMLSSNLFRNQLEPQPNDPVPHNANSR